jgi:hypothetical protein
MRPVPLLPAAFCASPRFPKTSICGTARGLWFSTPLSFIERVAARPATQPMRTVPLSPADTYIHRDSAINRYRRFNPGTSPGIRPAQKRGWLRGKDLNLRPLGYEPRVCKLSSHQACAPTTINLMASPQREASTFLVLQYCTSIMHALVHVDHSILPQQAVFCHCRPVPVRGDARQAQHPDSLRIDVKQVDRAPATCKLSPLRCKVRLNSLPPPLSSFGKAHRKAGKCPACPVGRGPSFS